MMIQIFEKKISKFNSFINESAEIVIKYKEVAEEILPKLLSTYPEAEIVYRGKHNNLARVKFIVGSHDVSNSYDLTYYCGGSDLDAPEFPYFCMEYISDEPDGTHTEKFKTIEELVTYCIGLK